MATQFVGGETRKENGGEREEERIPRGQSIKQWPRNETAFTYCLTLLVL